MSKSKSTKSKPSTYRPAIPLYHHRTDGGAEYLTDKFIACKGGHKEGIFEGANFIVRIDGDITKDAHLRIKGDLYIAAPELLAALEALSSTARTFRNVPKDEQEWTSIDDTALEQAFAAIAKAKGQS